MNTSTLLLDNPVCNFRCSYCGLNEVHNKNEKEKSKKDFNWEAIDKVLQEKSKEDSGSKGIKLSIWSGEPLMNCHLWELLDYINNNFKVEAISMVTNGSLLYPLRKKIMGYPFLRFNISNDLIYQSQRGPQYLENKNVSAFLKTLQEAGMISSFQTVVSGYSSHIMDQLNYLANWGESNNIDWKQIEWFLMPVRDYSGEDKGLILSLEDKEFVNQLTEFTLLSLMDAKQTPVFKSFYRKMEVEIKAMLEDPPKVYRPHCDSFRNKEPTFMSTSGERYYCTENFDAGIKEFNLNPPDEKCIKCVFQASCNSMCANLSTKAREASCPGMKAWHGIIQRVIYKGFTDEQRKRYNDLFGKDDMFSFISNSR